METIKEEYIEFYDHCGDPYGKLTSLRTYLCPCFIFDKLAIRVSFEYRNGNYEIEPKIWDILLYRLREDKTIKRRDMYYVDHTGETGLPKKYLDYIERAKNVVNNFDIDAAIVQQSLVGWRNKWIRYNYDGHVIKVDCNEDSWFNKIPRM